MHPLLDCEIKNQRAKSGELGVGGADYMLRNRQLCLNTLRSALHFLSRPHGEVRITVKDVYPYTEWHVPRLAEHAPPLVCKRVEMFENSEFPSYETRNVARDASFPAAQAFTSVFGFPLPAAANEAVAETADDLSTSVVTAPTADGAEQRLTNHIFPGCDLCVVKGFTSEDDKRKHNACRLHRKRVSVANRWAEILQEPDDC